MSNTAACIHPDHVCGELQANERRTIAQNRAYYGMEKRLGREASRAIVREVVGHECTRCLTRREMHDVLNRQRLMLGEPVARYNQERRRLMVRGPRAARGSAPPPSFAQLDEIERWAGKIPGFGRKRFEAMCIHYLKGKRAPETGREASNMIEALKRMALAGWKLEHPEEHPERVLPREPGTVLYFPPRPRAEPTPASTQSPDEEPPF